MLKVLWPLGFKNLEIYNKLFKILFLSIYLYRQGTVNFFEIKELDNF